MDAHLIDADGNRLPPLEQRDMFPPMRFYPYDEHVARIVDEALFFGTPPRWWVKSLWLGPLRLVLTHRQGWWLPHLSARIVR